MLTGIFTHSLIFLIFLIIFLYFVFNANIKGFLGEFAVFLRLSLLNKKKYKLLNNITLKSNNYTSQIDHLVISDFGIFVIETKNYSGWIFGSEKSEFWTQVLFKNKYKLYNPIRQNNSHILTLKNCLKEFQNIRYIPIVVFTSKSSLNIDTSYHVINSYNLNKTIKRYSSVYISEEEKNKIIEQIKSLNIKSSRFKKQHIKNIKEKSVKRAELINQNICPKCRGKLVLRNGKFGKFIGCSNYPNCNFTKSL